jgi:hypothetical protein
MEATQNKVNPSARLLKVIILTFFKFTINCFQDFPKILLPAAGAAARNGHAHPRAGSADQYLPFLYRHWPVERDQNIDE